MAIDTANLVPPPSIGVSRPPPTLTSPVPPRRSKLWLVVLLCVVVGVGLGVLVYQQSIAPQPASSPKPAASPKVAPNPSPEAVNINEVSPTGGTVKFGVVGDYGNGSASSLEVAKMLAGFNPDIILTAGDNNYPDGGADTIDDHIGKLYSNYIYPYKGKYGSTATTNRFFPTPGNHDWHQPTLAPYLDYFTLPGNERYYDLVWGPVHFFILDSDPAEPDGATPTSKQAQWLQSKMQSSTSKWQLVFMHHAPFSSSSTHGSRPAMQWPFESWGADAVFAGHDHTMERLKIGGIPYFVSGAGGSSHYPMGTPLSTSLFRNDKDNGAMLVEATSAKLTFNFYNKAGQLLDSSTSDGSAPALNPSPTPTPSATVTPSRSPVGSRSPSPSPSRSPVASRSPSPTPAVSKSPTPSKSPSATPVASTITSSTPTPTPRAAMPEGSALPDAGIFEVTVGTAGIGLVFVILGALGFLLL